MNKLFDFNNTFSYLPIFNGAITSDLIIIYFLYYTKYINSKTLKNWYKEFRLSAFIADIFIIVIGIIIARYIFYYLEIVPSLVSFILVVLLIQFIHDTSFYLFFKNIKPGTNKMLDFFKAYANEVGIGAIKGDSLILVLTVLFSYYYSTLNLNINLIILIILMYLVPYFIYTI